MWLRKKETREKEEEEQIGNLPKTQNRSFA